MSKGILLRDVRLGIGERTFAVFDWTGLWSRLPGFFFVGSVAAVSLGGKSSNTGGLEMVPDFESVGESRGLTDAGVDSDVEDDVDPVFDDVDLSFGFGSREVDFESAVLGRDSGFVDLDPLVILTTRGSLGLVLLAGRSAETVGAMDFALLRGRSVETVGATAFGVPVVFGLVDSGFDATLCFTVASATTAGVVVLGGGLSVVGLTADLVSGVVDFGLVSGVADFDLVSGVVDFDLVSGIVDFTLLSGVVDFSLLSDVVDFGLLTGELPFGLSSGGVNFCRLFSGAAELTLISTMLGFELVMGLAVIATTE